VDKLTGEKLTELLDAKHRSFDSRFESTFPLKQNGKFKPAEIDFAKAALSDLLGSLG